MNDFEKPITAEVRALVHEIVDRFLDYNPTKTMRDITGDKPTFMVRFSGHVSYLSVDIHEGGWEPDSEGESFNIPLCDNERVKKRLTAILDCMEEIYSDWEEKEHGNE